MLKLGDSCDNENSIIKERMDKASENDLVNIFSGTTRDAKGVMFAPI